MADATEEQSPPLIPVDEPREGTPPVISIREGLQAAATALRSASGPVAADAERASGYRYGQRAYLVQLRREGTGTLLIDPVAFEDLSAVDEVLEEIEKIHDDLTYPCP